MKRCVLTRSLLGVLFSVLFSAYAFGQGATTANIVGLVEDTNGEPLPGATIQAVHQPSGTTYGAATGTDGRFSLPNVRVGGPYQVTASFVGYNEQIRDDISLTLGQTLNLSFIQQESSIQLEDVVVTASQSEVLNGERTGADTKITTEQIQSLPTIQRDLNDFTRLTPQANLTNGGISIAGVNNRFNAIYIDGAVNNDVFGLAASGTNGGQTGVSPISLDAIDEIQVVIAPYDVKLGGFAGGGINAVTRSGTNSFEGSAYFLTRNERLAGREVTDNPEPGVEQDRLAPFNASVTGFRLGGPLIKNKLFFFVNGEVERRETPAPFDFSEYNNELVSRASIEEFANVLRNQYNYEPGGFEDVTNETRSDKIFARLDWNINQNHKLTLRHSYTYGETTSPSNSGRDQINFANGGVLFPSTTNTSALELNSRFSNNFANNLILGYTTVRDDRDPIGEGFPNIFIRQGNIRAGSERFSTANQLDQDVFTITDNFSWFKGAHTVTLGTHNEFYSIYNLFIRQNYGEYTYRTIEDFIGGTAPTEYRRQYSLLDDVTGDGSAAAASFNAFQLGFYLQDEWYATNNLKLTGGVRIDIPVFSDEPVADDNFNNNVLPELAQQYDIQGARAGKLPATNPMFSPRFGFNWDVQGDRTTQLRGGIGLFTSRLPFVWLGGSFTNSGVVLSEVRERPRDEDGNPAPITLPNGDPLAFRPDVNNQYERSDFGEEDVAGGQIDLFAEDFRLPQVLRASLAIDQQLGYGIVGTLEGLYTKTANNVVYQNINKVPPTQRFEGADNRLYYSGNITRDYTDVLLAYNTDQGYTWSVTGQLQKPFANGLFTSLAYTYGTSQAINDGTSSQNSSQWRYIENVNGRNNLPLTYSDFDLGHRVVGALSYGVSYANFLRTEVSLFYNGQSGSRYSYVYAENVNGEDFSENDLIYVPRNLPESYLVDRVGEDEEGNEIVVATAEEQWAALDAFIADDEYLSERRGEYAERNGSRTPFVSIFDVRVLQDFSLDVGGKTHTLQLSLDIFNFTNFLNKNWGRRYFVNNDNYRLIEVVSPGPTPEYNFSAPSNEVWQINNAGVTSSIWQMQVGLRYIFGD